MKGLSSSYLGGGGLGDPAASPRRRKAARTFSVSSRRSSSSEPAMEVPRTGAAERCTADGGLGPKPQRGVALMSSTEGRKMLRVRVLWEG